MDGRTDRQTAYRQTDRFSEANNKGADQSARMRRLVCAFVVLKHPKTGFLASRSNYDRAFPFAGILVCPQL